MYFDDGTVVGIYDIMVDVDNDDSTFFVGDTAMTVLLELDTAVNVAWTV
jgi:hypothetical protein